MLAPLVALELQHGDDVGRGSHDLELEDGGARGHAHGVYLAREGVDVLGAAAHLGLGDEGAAALLADDEALALQLAYGLADGGAGDVEGAAELALAGQQRAGP